jgi:hypothetical protein
MEGGREAGILEKRRSADQKVRAVRAQGWTFALRGQRDRQQEGTVKRQIKEDLAPRRLTERRLGVPEWFDWRWPVRGE